MDEKERKGEKTGSGKGREKISLIPRESGRNIEIR